VALNQFREKRRPRTLAKVVAERKKVGKDARVHRKTEGKREVGRDRNENYCTKEKAWVEKRASVGHLNLYLFQIYFNEANSNIDPCCINEKGVEKL
jgi:hypothetical protein